MNLIDREIEKFEKEFGKLQTLRVIVPDIDPPMARELTYEEFFGFLRSSLQRVIDETKLGHFWYCPFEDCDFMNDDRDEMCNHIKSHHSNKIVDETKMDEAKEQECQETISERDKEIEKLIKMIKKSKEKR